MNLNQLFIIYHIVLQIIFVKYKSFIFSCFILIILLKVVMLEYQLHPHYESLLNWLRLKKLNLNFRLNRNIKK